MRLITAMASILILLTAGCDAASEPVGGADTALTFRGASDASAAMALDERHFIMAEDEDNILRIYDIESPGLPASTLDLNPFLRPDPEHPEADIEDATRIGDTLLWITSHGRNKDGKFRPARYRFFATKVEQADGRWQVEPAGEPYTRLVQGMLVEPKLAPLNLYDVTQLDDDKDKDLAPKDEGLNIEALAADPAAGTAYIGLRNPLFKAPDGRRMAILIPLLNPLPVLLEGEGPRFDAAVMLDLQGRGVRAMEYSPLHKTFFLVAGPIDDESPFALYRWSGRPADRPEALQTLGRPADTTPEAILQFPNDPATLWLLSDDGTIEIPVANPAQCEEGELLPNGRCPNKYLIDRTARTFRAICVSLE